MSHEQMPSSHDDFDVLAKALGPLALPSVHEPGSAGANTERSNPVYKDTDELRTAGYQPTHSIFPIAHPDIDKA